MPFNSWAEYIEMCRPPTTQAPSENYFQNASAPNVSRPYFLDILWGLVPDPETESGAS